MNIVSFPNLLNYTIHDVRNILSNRQIFVATENESGKRKAIILYNLKLVNHLNIIHFFEAYRLNTVTSHQNLLNLYEIGTMSHGVTDYLYLVMDNDFIRLDSLETKFNNNDITLENSIKSICQVLDGLHHAHQYKIIHRNITTDCILQKGNETKLSNYHLLFTPGYFSKNEQLTLLSYKTPEFFYDKNLCNYLTDIYALGIVLFRCVNQFDNWLDVIKQVDNLKTQVKTSNLTHYIGYKNHVSNDIKKIINKACRSDLNNHYSSVLALKQDLVNLFNIKN